MWSLVDVLHELEVIRSEPNMEEAIDELIQELIDYVYAEEVE